MSVTTDNHVTNWGQQPMKFKVDVASMGKLGFDIVADHLSENDKLFCQQAVKSYNTFKDIVWHGDQYRLLNPHKNELSALMYVNTGKTKAIVFNYLVNNRFKITATERPVRLNGLDPNKTYSVKEINLYPGTTTAISERTYSGDFLMKVGINPNVTLKRTSVVLQLDEVK